MSRKNRSVLALAIVLAGVIVSAGFAATAAPAKTYLAVVTGSTGGTYYPVGTILATLWNEKLGASKGVAASAQSSGGTAENLNMLRAGEAELAIAMTNLTWFNYKGIEQYQGKPNPKLRILTGLWPDVTQFVVTKASKIETVADIKGKRFCTGATGSGTEYSSLAILRLIGGLADRDYRAEHLGYFESSAAMQNGQLDGFNAEGGVPTSAVAEIFASQTPVKLLQFSDEDYAKLTREIPFYVQYVIPANTYKNQTEDVKTLGVKCALICTSDLPDDIAYSLVKTMYENLAQIQASHKALGYLTLERAVQGLPPVPLHPGAAKFYQEMGLKLP
ncbi:MAG: TAXI family TRAP transporter solute-binding subunit [Firmicutes bacterium]|jgi:TRAP transporter TAXI family solute receptor|nr:TAXI family TRAP transporter solute-binding subunit [Bacillota bacterium]